MEELLTDRGGGGVRNGEEGRGSIGRGDRQPLQPYGWLGGCVLGKTRWGIVEGDVSPLLL